MKSLLFYLLQVIVVSGILYAYYYVALRNKKFHQYNRFYILAAALASILIPFLNIPVYFTNDDSSTAWLLQNLSGQPVIISLEEEVVEKTFNWQSLLYVLYALIGLFGLARVLFSISKLKKLMNEHPTEQLNGIRFINTAEPGTPFSFFSWLFWNNKIQLDSEKGEQIFRHEVFHIQQKHSLDIIFMEIVTIIFWVNPFFHLMKKELKAIHEFLADRFASNETQKWEYAEMLLMQALNTQHQLVHPFFHNQIKRRIAMITNPHKTSHQYLRKLLVLPLAALLVTLFAFSYRQKQSDPPLNENGLSKQSSLFVTDTIPAVSLLVEEVRADVDATRKGITVTEKQSPTPSLIIFNGKEYTRDEFSRMTGDRDRDVVIESRHVVSTSANDTKAIAKYGEKARDGVLEFKEASIDTIGPKKTPVRISLRNTTPDNEPLIVLDGVEQERNSFKTVLNDLNPNSIQSITVLKDSTATSIYGSKGEHGVLQITTKKEVTGTLTLAPKLEEVTVVGYGTKRVQGLQLAKTTEGRAISNRQVAGTDHELREVIVDGYPSRKTDSIRSVKITGQVTGVQLSPAASKVTNQKLEAVTVTATNNTAVVYPNPANNSVTLKMKTEQAGEAVLRILDMTGKEKMRNTTTLNKGENTFAISIAGLPPGTYIIRLDGPGKDHHLSYKLLKE